VTADIRRRPIRSSLLIAGLLLAIVGVVALSLATRATPYLRDRIVSALNGRFDSEVAVESLQVAVFPRPEVSGTGLVLRHHGRTDVAPLITVRSFTGSAGVAGLFATPLSLRSIELEGLTIHIPPGGVHAGTPDRSAAADASGNTAGPAGAHSKLPSLVISKIGARQARVEIASRDTRKPPRQFDIHDLVMTGFRPDAPAAFTAFLPNPVPRGEIETTGEFGPWLAKDPAQTAVRGRFAFRKANLDTIKGLAGILSATGQYDGVLERIAVSGETDTPEFQLDSGRRPVPLKTRFRAVVDGTNGNTVLEDVNATLAETPIRARGAIVREEGGKKREISLNVSIDDGRIEDVLRLAADTAQPPLTGRVRVQSTVLVPPGEGKVIDRLQLDGQFTLAQARFTSYDVQKRITLLSQRARGDTGDVGGASVVSNLQGRFVLRDGVLRLAGLTFAVPGAVVRLDGTYVLRTQAMDFKGNLLLDAKLAETTTGAKSVIGTILQPLFQGPKGGTKLPIKVTGTRQAPQFGLDVKRALSPG
jgi:uncharacterized protein involved in outer membrane biogenesis